MPATSSRLHLRIKTLIIGLAGGIAAAAVSAPSARPVVALLNIPDRGIQPQIATDSKGRVYLLYFQGDPGAGDLYYARLLPGGARFSPSLRVNSQPGSAVAVGTIRGGQIAVGKDSRVHVAWNGSDRAIPRRPKNSSPLLYARMNLAGDSFEPARNLMRRTFYLDGGGTLTADSRGNVFVAWHAADSSSNGESGRKLWVAISRDGGKTFSPETSANRDPTGACACCGTRAFTDRRGNIYILYRSARESVHRDMILLSSRNRGKSFAGRNLHPWNINACPMSSESFAEGPEGVYGAWETKGRVYFSRIDPKTLRTTPPVAAPWHGRGQKHPALAVNGRGEVLLAWTEGTGWQQGGDLAWQLYGRDGKPLTEKGQRKDAIPAWSTVAAFTRPDGRFGLIY